MTASALLLPDPQATATTLVNWIRDTYQRQGKAVAVIAVSGGVDSALSLTLLCQALGSKNVYPLLLPYGDQDMNDGHSIIAFNNVPATNILTYDIRPSVDNLSTLLHRNSVSGEAVSEIRRGNMMARVRMIAVFDRAKALDALVCGTENKSEHWLGYWTRFGDAASDLEPLNHLYKTQVWQLAEHLHLPAVFLTKAPSAGLWDQQTDESEMGFSYHQADLVLSQVIDVFYAQHGFWPTAADVPNNPVVKKVEAAVVNRILDQVRAMAFKLQVPYEPPRI